MDQKQSVSCSRTVYSVDHNVIHEANKATSQEETVIDAYQDEAEWADRNQSSFKPDYITQKS